MTINTKVKKLKQKYRPVKWAKKLLRTKKNQRRLIYGVGVVIILGLLVGLGLAINEQNNLQREVIRYGEITDKNSKDIQGLKSDVGEKQKEIEKNLKTIKASSKEKKKLEAKIKELNGEIQTLKSYGNGIGGGAVAPRSNLTVTSGNAYGYGYCTWYVKNKRPDVGSFWGDARNWYASAQAAGFDVGHTPKVGAIGVEFNTANGHVVYIESVNGNTVHLSEMNGYAGWNTVGERDAPASDFVYIYWKS